MHHQQYYYLLKEKLKKKQINNYKTSQMTVATKNWLKTNLFNLSTLLAMLTFIVIQAQRQERVDIHIEDGSVHMPFEKKIEIFVPRTDI